MVSSLDVGEDGGVSPRRDLSSVFSVSNVDARCFSSLFSFISFLFCKDNELMVFRELYL